MSQSQRVYKSLTLDEKRNLVLKVRKLPLFSCQVKHWKYQKYDPESSFFNVPLEIRFEGELNVKILERSLIELIKRHEALRIRFVDGPNGPFQYLSLPDLFHLQVVDLRFLDKPTRNHKIDDWINNNALSAPDIIHSPIFNATLLQTERNVNLLLLRSHHIVCDGISCFIILDELPRIYRSLLDNPATQFEKLRSGYMDLIESELSRAPDVKIEEQLQYWKAKLNGAPSRFVFSEPADRLDSRRTTPVKAEALSDFITADVYSRIKNFCKNEGLTPFMYMLSAFNLGLFLLTGQSDFIVGSVITNRSEFGEDALKMVGEFTNPISLRAQIHPEMSIKNYLVRTKDVVLEAHANGTCPFETIIDEINKERKKNGDPVLGIDSINIDFIMHNLELHDRIEFTPRLIGHATSRPTGLGHKVAILDLSIHVQIKNGGIQLDAQYNSSQINRAKMRLLLRSVILIAQTLFQNTESKIGQLEKISSNKARNP